VKLFPRYTLIAAAEKSRAHSGRPLSLTEAYSAALKGSRRPTSRALTRHLRPRFPSDAAAALSDSKAQAPDSTSAHTQTEGDD